MRKTALILVGLNLLASVINALLGNWPEASFTFATAALLSNLL